VVLFCLCGLTASLIVALRGDSHFRGPSHQQIVATPRSVLTRAALPEQNIANDLSQAAVIRDIDRARLLQRIRAAFNSGQPADEAAVFSDFFPQLIEIDPWAAAQFAESPQAAESRTDLMRVLARNWAQADIAGATNWIAQLADPNERDTMLSCVCFGIAEGDPQLAVQTLEQQGLNERRNVMLGNLAQQWASQDMQAAIAWADNCPTGEIRDNLFRHIALAESDTAPAESAQLVMEQISPGSVQEEAISDVLQRWARQDMSGAFAWVKQLPSGAVRDRAVQVLSGMNSYAQANVGGQSHIQQ